MGLEEIKKRLAEIKADTEKRSETMTQEEIDAYEKEVKELLEKRKWLEDTGEKRAALLKSIADGSMPSTVIRTFASAVPSPAANPEQRNADNDDVFDTVEYRRVFMDYVVRDKPIAAEYRADATSKTSDVGAVIPTTVLNTIIEKLEATGMILPMVTRTAYKGGVSIPASTVKPTATWVNEGAGSDKQKKTVAKNDMITFAYHKLRCAVAVSLEVDNMAMNAFESALINNVVEAMTKALEQAIIDGNGTGKPKGILAETAQSDRVIQISALSYDDLVAAEAALPQAYENGAVWCMSKKTFMQYYGLTDSQGQPIGRVNHGIAGKPERSLLGRPVVVCDYVTSFASGIAAGTKFGFLFNFKDYVLNTNYAMGIKKYEDNDNDDLITKAIMLADGKVVDNGSLVVLSKKA